MELHIVMIHRNILRGSCNNVQDVRNHWEHVKLSYEILKDPLRRKRYDCNEVWSDPGRAVRRAATEAALEAVFSAGKGVWGIGTSFGSSVSEGVSKAAEKARQQAVAWKKQEESKRTTNKNDGDDDDDTNGGNCLQHSEMASGQTRWG
ncbi:hypothetical protein ACA910_016129 [Epithemia clementina (nom. ined.)]